MEQLFQYNWEVRDEWFEICSELPHDELVQERVGGVGSILKTLFHIIDVEYSWIKAIQNETITDPDYSDYLSLELVRALSVQYQKEIIEFIRQWSSEDDEKEVSTSWDHELYTGGEILRHVLVHEIHHIGQLSVWSRALGVKPASANFINRNIRKTE
ncbi:putative damage-inducible protein DinB [Paenibacillus sp. DS2015]|uniref:DinB family protein n=1 Tax=Paenibacillus sp. DS2015 TaxID=3373917 RepID=UPI003D1C3C02